MSKIGQAILDRLEKGEDMDQLIEKGLQNDSSENYQEC